MTSIDKQTASRRLIASAVKDTFWEEDILGIHVRTMAAYDLLREYADAKKLALSWDLRDFIKEEHFKEAIKDYFKKPYNFLKHAKDDADATLDVSKLEDINDIFLLWVARMHHDCFKEWSKHQSLFVNYMAFSRPNIIKDGTFKETINENLKTLKADTRGAWLKLFRGVYVDSNLFEHEEK
ncbi:hypothetical protein [Hyphomicrobium sp. DMF-1]|jgi:hypothetical protein|uniref:hypothetical protein n=1 Tax=Hyphomicrobium sp. DMF-1 TaxID=3019544 RepID=UPI0022EBAD55|nr:hypothetical protein [Hyphomicrobium sp. DMF-1]WBT36573.1 hypothetical protein PE058_13010 [Hyphomicrobium sp. DMF-1]